MSQVRDRVEDYLKMGVPHVWVLDPESHATYSITPAEGHVTRRAVDRLPLHVPMIARNHSEAFVRIPFIPFICGKECAC